MGRVIIDITVPVAPASRKFIHHLYAGIGYNVPEIPQYFRRDLAKLVKEFSIKIAEKIKPGSYVKGQIVLEYDDNTKKPLRIFTKELIIYESGTLFAYPIIVENRE
ncbi:MAG: hypothetical protein ACO2ON_01560 [Candidatus Nanopusillus sp.]